LTTGILGGTFDPIHLGHLRAAESAREALQLDKVVFVPARVPPHRPDAVSPPLDRYAMVALATSGHAAFSASDIELRREGPSYTVDTVGTWLQENPGDDVVIIVGSDTFPDMATWRDPERLFAMCRIAVVDRPGEARGELAGAPPGTRRVEGPGLPISATLVRRRARAGQSVRYLVPDGVADYISKRGLYR
jgi:nicotinate-nucleotide adenylyltransferase